jgi:hypothetical protein
MLDTALYNTWYAYYRNQGCADAAADELAFLKSWRWL